MDDVCCSLNSEHCSYSIFGLPGTRTWPISASSRCPPRLDQTRRWEAELPGIHQASARGFVALYSKGLAYTIHPRISISINQGDDRWLSQSLAGACVRVCVVFKGGWRVDGLKPMQRRREMPDSPCSKSKATKGLMLVPYIPLVPHPLPRGLMIVVVVLK